LASVGGGGGERGKGKKEKNKERGGGKGKKGFIQVTTSTSSNGRWKEGKREDCEKRGEKQRRPLALSVLGGAKKKKKKGVQERGGKEIPEGGEVGGEKKREGRPIKTDRGKGRGEETPRGKRVLLARKGGGKKKGGGGKKGEPLKTPGTINPCTKEKRKRGREGGGESPEGAYSLL